MGESLDVETYSVLSQSFKNSDSLTSDFNLPNFDWTTLSVQKVGHIE